MTDQIPHSPRRRILYIRHQRTLDISPAFKMNQDEWVETLSGLADVTVKNETFDLDEACDQVEPDFILYESPFYHPAPLVIKNINTHPHIPRLALMMQDPFCSIRVNFLRIIQDLNIHWIFTHLPEALLRQSPELKLRTFSVSLLFDPGIFQDYGLKKDIPFSVFGGLLAPEIYRWRYETARKLIDHFPTLIYKHPGYRNPIPQHKFSVTGRDYAELLNRSAFSLADTTRVDYLVRKHLEIPASGALLVAPDAPVLKPYGFRDMENCILGEGDNLIEKLRTVADAPELYETIRKAGHDLVHARYTREKWRGILDFYECLRTLKPGETICQEGILGVFKAIPAAEAMEPVIRGSYPDSEISSLFKRWLDYILATPKLELTAQPIFEMPDWLPHMEEAFVLMGVMTLLKGDLVRATELFLAPQTIRKRESGFLEYDPEEIAWISIVAALKGDAPLLDLTRKNATSMRHLSLRRTQWLSKVLASGGDPGAPPEDVLKRKPDDHLSVHWTGQLDFKDWLRLMRRILAANGQDGLLRG